MKKKIIAYVTSHGHMDIEWYQPLDTYRYWMSEALEMLSEFQKENKDQTYILDGSVFPVEAVLKLHPEYEEKLKDLIKNRKLLVGPFYTQFDEFLNSGETIIENCLYGDRLSKKYGAVMKAGYLPDNFGHPSQLPQIFRGFGIDNLLFTRGMPNTKQGNKEFLFVGDDDSYIYGVNFAYYATFSIYFNNDPLPCVPYIIPGSKYFLLDFQGVRNISEHLDNEKIAKEIIENARAYSKHYPSGIVPMFMGCDHCPPQKNILKTLELANSMQDDIEFIFGDGDGYSEILRNNVPDTLETFKGNLLGISNDFLLLGAMTSRTYIKRQHDNCEHMLFDYALPTHCIAEIAGIKLPETMLDDSIKKLLINSTHDTIHGSSLDTVHIEQEYRYSAIAQNSMWTFNDALEQIGRSMVSIKDDRSGSVIVYSPVGVKNSICETYIFTNGKNLTLYDSKGNEVECEILQNEPMQYNLNGEPSLTPPVADSQRRIRFVAKGESTIERYTYVLDSEEITAKPSEDKVIENEFFKVSFENNTINLFDIEQNISYEGLNGIVEMADDGDIWDYSDTWTEQKTYTQADFETSSVSVTKGPLSSTLSYSYTMLLPEKLEGGVRSSNLLPSPVTFNVTLYKGIRRVDVSVTINNRSCDHCVRLRIPNVDKEENLLTGGIFTVQHIDSSVYLDGENGATASNREMPFRDFVSYQNENEGLLVAAKGLYTYEYKNNAIEIPMFRSVGFMSKGNLKGRKPNVSTSWPIDGAQCLRELTFEFSYIPTKKGEKLQSVFGTLDSYLRPSMAHSMARKYSGTLPESITPVEITNTDNVTVSVFRKTYDGDGAILRVYETVGETGTVKLKSSVFNRFFISNMNEEIISELPVENGEVSFDIDPHKVITVLMKN